MTQRSFPRVELPELDLDAVTAAARDAFYVTVGFGVLAVQRAQVRRRELAGRFGELDGRFDELETRLDAVVNRVTERLPEPAGGLLAQAHGAARDARTQVRHLVLRAA